MQKSTTFVRKVGENYEERENKEEEKKMEAVRNDTF
jgi:hypothetical protein